MFTARKRLAKAEPPPWLLSPYLQSDSSPPTPPFLHLCSLLSLLPSLGLSPSIGWRWADKEGHAHRQTAQEAAKDLCTLPLYKGGSHP